MNRETDYSALSEAVRFLVRQTIGGLYVCLPGLVEEYDPGTRRAKAVPALRAVSAEGEPIDRPKAVDLPVIWPTVQGFMLTGKLERGDPVLLMYCQRGLSRWKQTHDISLPDPESFFSAKDAVVLAGFGPALTEPITSVTSTGIAIQDYAGDNYIALEPDGIRIRTEGTVQLTDSRGTRTL